jgi:hypothetical protein
MLFCAQEAQIMDTIETTQISEQIEDIPLYSQEILGELSDQIYDEFKNALCVFELPEKTQETIIVLVDKFAMLNMSLNNEELADLVPSAAQALHDIKIQCQEHIKNKS